MTGNSKGKGDYSKVIVIAPVSSDPDFSHKMVLLAECCRQRNLSVRAPLAKASSFDLESELGAICHAKLIIADLSNERPSCYYEIGLAEAMRTPVRLLAKNGTTIHQHSGLVDVQFYRNLQEYLAIIEGFLDSFD